MDWKDFNANVPSDEADAEGRANWLSRAPPALIMAGRDDVVIDRQGVEETARFFGEGPERVIWMPSVPHDAMLASGWENAADVIIRWVQLVETAGGGAVDPREAQRDVLSQELFTPPPQAGDGTCERRARERRLLQEQAALEPQQETWLEEWGRRLDCWWPLVPFETRAEFSACMGALALHIASRLDFALRVSTSWGFLPTNRDAQLRPKEHAAVAEPGCEWVKTEAPDLELPQFPDFSQFMLPPLPRLLPNGEWQMRLQSRIENLDRMTEDFANVEMMIDEIELLAMAQQEQDHAQLGTVLAAGGVGGASALALLAAGALFVRGRRKLGRPTVQRRA